MSVRRVRTDAEYEDALAVRHAVFVDEQGVPEDLEVDEHEADATHYVAYDSDGVAVGAARSRPADDDTLKVERVAVLEARRGEGWGSRLMDAIETDGAGHGYDAVVLHAQLDAEAFYAHRGYERLGEAFEEAGIAHVEMEKRLGE